MKPKAETRLLFILTTALVILQQHVTKGTQTNTSNTNISKVLDVDQDNESNSYESILLNSSNTAISLQEICRVTNISMADCSCNATPVLCKLEISEIIESSVYVRSHQLTVIYAIVTVLASTFGAFGNIAVLAVAYKQRSSLSSCKLHIAELAVVNLVFSLASIISVGHLFGSNTWFLDVGSCKFIRTLLELCGLLSIGIILIIAVERFCLILYSIEVEGRCKHIVVVINMIFVIVTVIPYIIGVDIEKGSGRCIEFEGKSKHLSLPYSWFALISFSFLPLCIISVLYGRIVSHISRQALHIDRSTNHVLFLKRVKENRHVMLVAFSILLCFLVCTLPTRIIRIYLTMRHMSGEGHFTMVDMDLHVGLVFFSYVTYPFQSTLNPVMYSCTFKTSGCRLCRKLSLIPFCVNRKRRRLTNISTLSTLSRLRDSANFSTR